MSAGQGSDLPPDPPVRTWQIGTLTYTMGGLVVLFFWLLWGDFAWSLKERSVTSVVQLMLKNLDTSDMLAGFLIGSLPSAITIILGPVISYRSDRHRSRWGRRIPYLVVTTPIAALSMAGLAVAPSLGESLHGVMGVNSPGAYPLTMVIITFFWTVFEIATIAANAVFTGLINDVVPHELLGRFYGLFRALSLIAGIIFSYFILGKAEEHFEWVFIGIGLVYAIGFTIMCLKVKEGNYPPPPQPAPRKGGVVGSWFDRLKAAVATYFRECFTNPYYIWVFVALSVPALSFAPVNLFSVFFAKSVDISMDEFGKYIALTYFLSLVLSYPLGWLCDKIHPLRMSIIVLFLYMLVAAWGGVFARGHDTFAVAFILHCVLSGSFFTCSASLGQRLFPQSRFAQFASAAVSMTAIGTMILGPTLGGALDLLGHVYRHTYTLSCLLSAIGLVALCIVYRRWLRLGGAESYRAPE